MRSSFVHLLSLYCQDKANFPQRHALLSNRSYQWSSEWPSRVQHFHLDSGDVGSSFLLHKPRLDPCLDWTQPGFEGRHFFAFHVFFPLETNGNVSTRHTNKVRAVLRRLCLLHEYMLYWIEGSCVSGGYLVSCSRSFLLEEVPCSEALRVATTEQYFRNQCSVFVWQTPFCVQSIQRNEVWYTSFNLVACYEESGSAVEEDRGVSYIPTLDAMGLWDPRKTKCLYL